MKAKQMTSFQKISKADFKTSPMMWRVSLDRGVLKTFRSHWSYYSLEQWFAGRLQDLAATASPRRVRSLFRHRIACRLHQIEKRIPEEFQVLKRFFLILKERQVSSQNRSLPTALKDPTSEVIRLMRACTALRWPAEELADSPVMSRVDFVDSSPTNVRRYFLQLTVDEVGWNFHNMPGSKRVRDCFSTQTDCI